MPRTSLRPQTTRSASGGRRCWRAPGGSTRRPPPSPRPSAHTRAGRTTCAAAWPRASFRRKRKPWRTRSFRVSASRGMDRHPGGRAEVSTNEGETMRGRFRAAALGAACLVALGAMCLIELGGAQAQATQPQLRLDFYSAQVSAAQYSDLLAKGYDVTAAHDLATGKRVDLVLSPQQLKTLRDQGVRPTVKRNKFGLTARQAAARQAAAGFTVWRDYDSPDGIAGQLKTIA